MGNSKTKYINREDLGDKMLEYIEQLGREKHDPDK